MQKDITGKQRVANTGMVAFIDGEFAYVNIARKGACGDNCASCSAACEQNEHLTKVYNTLGVKKGDTVELNLDADDFLKMSALLYLVPLIIMVTSIIGLEILTSNTTLSILTGLALTGISFPVINRYVKHKNSEGKLVIRMSKKL